MVAGVVVVVEPHQCPPWVEASAAAVSGYPVS